MADFSILTEDNNRFEKVEDILADIRVGMNKGNPDAKFVEIPDRLDALHYAVDHAQEGDLIAVIGKGHETYRDREGVKTPFLERSWSRARRGAGLSRTGKTRSGPWLWSAQPAVFFVNNVGLPAVGWATPKIFANLRKSIAEQTGGV